jgi:hypothetical protein
MSALSSKEWRHRSSVTLPRRSFINDRFAESETGRSRPKNAKKRNVMCRGLHSMVKSRQTDEEPCVAELGRSVRSMLDESSSLANFRTRPSRDNQLSRQRTFANRGGARVRLGPNCGLSNLLLRRFSADPTRKMVKKECCRPLIRSCMNCVPRTKNPRVPGKNGPNTGAA